MKRAQRKDYKVGMRGIVEIKNCNRM